MPRLQGLIFDLDGTLLDSAPDIRQAVNLMLEQNGLCPLSLDAIKGMLGDGAMILVQRAMAAAGAEPVADVFPLVQQFIGHYRNIKADPSQIYPHVLPVLEQYRGAGVKLGVCTNKQETATYRVLEQLDLLNYFEFIAGGDTFPVHKPNPEHLLGVVRALDVPREGCVYVGDGINDIRAAHGAKIPCIVVTHGYGAEEETVTRDADSVIAGFDELPGALKILGFDLV